MRWQPITDRALRSRAGRAIRELAAILAEPVAGASPSLALGDAGTAVFFAYLARASFPVKHAADRARVHARRAAQAVGDAGLPLGLFGGVAGIAWMLDHLRGAELPRRDLCGELDAALRGAIAGGALDGEIDLVHGLCGIGVYAIARRDHALASRVVARLRACSAARGEGVVWARPGAPVDLGAAHGLVGLVAMLGQARGARVPGATMLCRGALRSLLGHARWDRASVFPAFAVLGDAAPGNVAIGDSAVGDSAVGGAALRDSAVGDFARGNVALGDAVHGDAARADAARGDVAVGGVAAGDARLAWCYGDIGAMCALQTVAEATGDARLRETALRVARAAAVRAPASSGVVDCGICHGAAGVAFGLQRMFVASGELALRDAARDWLAGALDEGIPVGLRD
ncbi:MAG TPA: lanthionine synthetase LanC family protein, partial [Kofleriaceae bacterium]